MHLRSLIWLTVTVVFAVMQSTWVHAQQPSVRLYCTTCSLTLSAPVRLGSESDSVVVSATAFPPAVDGRGRFFASSALGASVAVYDGAGKLIRTVGREGDAPDEFPRPYPQMFIGNGDTLYLSFGFQMKVYSPALAWIRNVELAPPLSVADVLPDGRILSVGRLESAASATAGMPLHLRNRSGAVVRSFGSVTPVPSGCAACMQYIAAHDGRNGDFWVATPGKYELSRWDSAGQLIARYSINGAPWFREWTPGAPRNSLPVTARGSSISQMHIDSAGTLWIHGLIPIPGTSTPMDGADRMVTSSNATPVDMTFGHVIDVFDTRTMRHVGSYRNDKEKLELIGRGRIGRLAELSSGLLFWDVLQARW